MDPLAEDEDERSKISLFLERLGLNLSYQRQLKSCGGVILTRIVTGIVKNINAQSYHTHAQAMPGIVMTALKFKSPPPPSINATVKSTSDPAPTDDACSETSRWVDQGAKGFFVAKAPPSSTNFSPPLLYISHRLYVAPLFNIDLTAAPFIVAVGGICAATASAYKYGRKKVITVVIILYLVPLLISATDLGPFVDYLGSLTNQFGQNMIPVMYSIYTLEVVDAKLRAFFIGLYFPATRIGSIISQLLPLPSKLAILCGLILIITALVLSVLAPETPYWLALVGRREEAERVVEWLKDGPANAVDSTYVFERAEYDAQRKYTEIVPIILSRRFYIPIVLYTFAVLGSFDLCALFNAAGFRHADDLGMNYSFIHNRVAAEYTVINFIRDVYFFLGCGLYQFLCMMMGRRRMFLMSMLLSLAFFWTNLAGVLGVAPFMVILHACEVFMHMGTVQVNVLYPIEIFPSILRELGVGTCYAMFVFLGSFENYGKLNKPRSVADFVSVMIFTGYPVGLVFSYLMMPETKDIPQADIETVARYLKVKPLTKDEDEEDES